MRQRLALGGLAVLAALLVFGLASAAPAKSTSSKKSSTKKSTKAVADSNRVLVRMGKETITQGDLQRRINSLPEQFRANYSTPEGRQQLLDRMVEEKVWLIQASKNGVPDRPQVKQQIEQQKRDLVIRTYLNEVMAKNPAVSDSEAKVYYDAHPDEFKTPASISVRHIQTKSAADAKKVKSLAKVKDWVALAKQYSTDTLTKATGGNLGVITKDGAFGSLGNQPALAESAFTIPEGKVGGPYQSDKGWHVLRVDQVRPASVRPFDQVKPLISRQLGSQHQQDYYKQQLDQARKSVGVTVDSAAVKKFISQKRSARDMFNDAQALGPAEQRIAAYQDLLQQYPSSDVSPQAQFMIGFIYSEELKKYDEAEQAFRALLQRYPKAELAPSAQWMIDHMRSNDTPAFVNAEADSLTGHATTPATSSTKNKKPASNSKQSASKQAAQPQATVPSTPPNYRP